MKGEMTLPEAIMHQPLMTRVQRRVLKVTPPGITETLPQRSTESQPDPRAVTVPSEQGGPGIGVFFPGHQGEVEYIRAGTHFNVHLVYVTGGPAEVTVIGGAHRITDDHAQVVKIAGQEVKKVWIHGKNLKLDATELPEETHISKSDGARLVKLA